MSGYYCVAHNGRASMTLVTGLERVLLCGDCYKRGRLQTLWREVDHTHLWRLRKAGLAENASVEHDGRIYVEPHALASISLLTPYQLIRTKGGWLQLPSTDDIEVGTQATWVETVHTSVREPDWRPAHITEVHRNPDGTIWKVRSEEASGSSRNFILMSPSRSRNPEVIENTEILISAELQAGMFALIVGIAFPPKG